MPSRRTDPLDPGRGTDQAEPESPAAVAERLGPEYRPPRRQRPPQRTPCLCSEKLTEQTQSSTQSGNRENEKLGCNRCLQSNNTSRTCAMRDQTLFQKLLRDLFHGSSQSLQSLRGFAKILLLFIRQSIPDMQEAIRCIQRCLLGRRQSLLRVFSEDSEKTSSRCSCSGAAGAQILLGVLLQRRLLDQSGGRRLLQHPRLAHLAEEMRPESLSQYRINDMLQKLFVGKIRQWLLRQQETTTETLRPDFSLLCDRGSVRLQKQSRRPELPELSTETEP